MPLETYGVTFRSIEKSLKGFPLDDVADDIDEIIQREVALLQVHLKQQGILEETETSGTRAYLLCQLYIILVVAAEVGEDFTHQDPDLSKSRRERADKILEAIRRKPESIPDEFDRDKHRGSFRAKNWTDLSSSAKRGTGRGEKYFGS